MRYLKNNYAVRYMYTSFYATLVCLYVNLKWVCVMIYRGSKKDQNTKNKYVHYI
jgi:hypothetical protein